MDKENKSFDPREYMKLAIKVINQSIQEPRDDKSSPKVGAVLIKSDGVVETAFRGELRHGDHAEFTLLERKNRSTALDGGILFATLEPCSPGARKHPKLGCAERIVNARIKKVWIGIEDPDPTVDRKGIQFLIDNGVEVEMFDSDLQLEIRNANKTFIQEAEDRAKQSQEEAKDLILSLKEKVEIRAELNDLSIEDLNWFLASANIEVEINTPAYYKVFAQLGFIESKDNVWKPTGLGLLLFGNRPQLIYQNALIRATFKTKGRGEEIITIEGAITRQADKIQKWYESHIFSQIDRSHVEREVKFDFPLEVLREAIINAIVHRDYDIEGAPIYFEINDDAIIIKSPGEPVAPLKFEQIRSFSAPSLSRNPKIMYVFDQLKIVEQRGFGFLTIKELPDKYELPLPIVTYGAPYMVMTFPRSQEVAVELKDKDLPPVLNAAEKVGFRWIQENEPISTRDYSSHFNVGYKTAQRFITKLKTIGLVIDNGESINSPNYKYKTIKIHHDK